MIKGLLNKKFLLLTILCLVLINFVSAAYMECLVKTSDNVVSNSPREEWTEDIFETEMTGNSKQGYIVGCEAAGYPWGSGELNPTKYAIINISEEDFNASWLEPDYDYENPNPLTHKENVSYHNCLNYCPTFCEGAGLYWLCIADCEADCDAQYTPYPTITKRKYRLPLESFMDITNQDGTGIDDLKAIACDDITPRPVVIKNLTNVNALVVYNDWLTGPYDWVGPGDANCDFYSKMGNWTINTTYQLVGYPRYARDRSKVLILNVPITLERDGVTIQSPAGITIKSYDLFWDGTITLPTLQENASLIPQNATPKKVFEVGFANAKLNFDQAVKIIIPGEAGSLVGYSRGGENFTEITTNCSNNTQTWANESLGDEEECKIDVGDDLVIWTKHFTEFVTYTFNEPPTADAGGPYTENEGTQVIFDAFGSSDPDGDALQYRWDFENDGSWDTDYSTDPTASYTWNDDYSGTVLVEVSDGEEVDTDTTTVTVNNVAPTITDFTGPIEPYPIGTNVEITATFTDPGADTHTAEFVWGDGAILPGDVSDGTVTGTHTYTEAGVYTVTLTVTDDDGDSDTEIFQYVVIYDPDGGFVTGVGWIDSPAGAYMADSTLVGKASFGFVSKYKKGATTPTGDTEFKFKAGDLKFYSDSYDWLVIAGQKAMYKGTGTINDVGNYGFLLSAIDEALTPSTDVDLFRIKIWDEDNGDEVVYDNQFGDADDADPATELQGGKIVIHKAK